MDEFPHLNLPEFLRAARPYTSPGKGGDKRQSPPRPERTTHGEKLLADLQRAEKQAKLRLASDPTRMGLQFIPMRFAEGSAFTLAIKQLESKRGGIHVVSARERRGGREYIVAVPDAEVASLAEKFRKYRDEDSKHGKPKNEPLASSISTIDSAEIADYWTEAAEELPESDEVFWWEVWLDANADGVNVEEWFRETARQQKVLLSNERVRFPERVVILAYSSLDKWREFPGLLNYLAEFRRAKIVAGEFTRLNPAGQAEYINDLIGRTRYAGTDSTCVCILDTGVDRGHPLLEQALLPNQLHTWREEWGADDHEGHGTLMAGVCLYGVLSDSLYNGEPLTLLHALESVKILPRHGQNEAPDYGPITVGAMALAETQAPNRSRVFCLAVTASGDDQWRPSLWSAAIDQACAGSLDGFRRLLVVAAGNLREEIGVNYPIVNQLSSVEDPAQAWNALTVGAYTDLTWIAERGLEGYTPIATPGSLSPASRTSLCWGDEPWPYKPDVVFEGGNYAADSSGFVTSADDLELLTTQSSVHSTAQLGTIRDTSAATALAARMAAILQSEYPEYWPESIRGLIVHSAEWTPAMLQEFPRRERKNRLRVYGMGVPNLTRARRSARGYTTMVVQDTLQPYAMKGTEGVANEMHVHELPLPSRPLISGWRADATSGGG